VFAVPAVAVPFEAFIRLLGDEVFCVKVVPVVVGADAVNHAAVADPLVPRNCPDVPSVLGIVKDQLPLAFGFNVTPPESELSN
jgi:hypothetical protein